MSGSTIVVWALMMLYCSPNDNICEYVAYRNLAYPQDVICQWKVDELKRVVPQEKFKCKIVPEDIFQ